MSLEIVADTWAAVVPSIPSREVDEAAYRMVVVLVDLHGIEAVDIKKAFSDPAVLRAVAEFSASEPEPDEDDDDMSDDYAPPYYDDED